MDNILVNPAISFYIGAFVQWGFLMAFLYSLVISINKPSIVINLADFMMLAIFFINKDFLALAAIKIWFHNSIMKRNNSSG